MKLKNRLFTLLIAGMAPCLASTLDAAIVVTYSGPSAETSSLSGSQVFTFDQLSTGLNTNVKWSGVGTFNQLDIVNPNLYGGAGDTANPNGTRYSVQGLSDLVSRTTLTLNQNSGYFGIWLSAADPSNMIQFYQNGTLVGQFTTNNLLSELGPDYLGNPRNRTQNSTQDYVFLNFFGDATTKWNSIAFSGSSSSAAFESDNYTSRVGTYNQYRDGGTVPGTPSELLNGAKETVVSPTATGAALWGSSEAVPGAPAPSITLLGVFGLVFLAKSRMFPIKNARADG